MKFMNMLILPNKILFRLQISDVGIFLLYKNHKYSCFRLFLGCAAAQQLKSTQEDPCQTKARVVGDATYCDRYWECVNGQPELYDCPNGLVFAGKNRGVTEGCDYLWRSNYCGDGKQQASKCFTS